jgi:hypothetical protein
MNLPGENTITLTDEALMGVVQDALNASRYAMAKVRVTAISRSAGYRGETAFTVTTDPEPCLVPLAAVPAPEPLDAA